MLPEPVAAALRERRCRWLVTGAAGFIGSHLLEALLDHDQRVVGLDDLSTGSSANLDEVRSRAGEERWEGFRFVHADIRSLDACLEAVDGVDVVLHQAALGPVPRSVEGPDGIHSVNVLGTVNVLEAARLRGRPRVVYASSSAVYGDDPRRPRAEDHRGRPLSLFAAVKVAGEMAAGVYTRAYGVEAVGLRYFEVFGPRQRANGPCAAVVPRWIRALIDGRPVVMRGDKEAGGDFCYVADVVQANLRAALTEQPGAVGSVVNVGTGKRTRLSQLYEEIRGRVARAVPEAGTPKPAFEPFHPEDRVPAEADISRAKRLLGYRPGHDLQKGLDETVAWYLESIPGPARRV